MKNTKTALLVLAGLGFLTLACKKYEDGGRKAKAERTLTQNNWKTCDSEEDMFKDSILKPLKVIHQFTDDNLYAIFQHFDDTVEQTGTGTWKLYDNNDSVFITRKYLRVNHRLLEMNYGSDYLENDSIMKILSNYPFITIDTFYAHIIQLDENEFVFDYVRSSEIGTKHEDDFRKIKCFKVE